MLESSCSHRGNRQQQNAAPKWKTSGSRRLKAKALLSRPGTFQQYAIGWMPGMSLTGLGLGALGHQPGKAASDLMRYPEASTSPASQGACLGVAEFGRLLRENHVILDYASPGALQSGNETCLPILVVGCFRRV